MRSCQDKDLLAAHTFLFVSHTHTQTRKPGNGLVSGVVWMKWWFTVSVQSFRGLVLSVCVCVTVSLVRTVKPAPWRRCRHRPRYESSPLTSQASEHANALTHAHGDPHRCCTLKQRLTLTQRFKKTLFNIVVVLFLLSCRSTRRVWMGVCVCSSLSRGRRMMKLSWKSSEDGATETERR